MLDDGAKQQLRAMNSELKIRLMYDTKNMIVLERQIRDTREKIAAIDSVLDENINEPLPANATVPLLPKPGTRTDAIRMLFENNPKIGQQDVISEVKRKFPSSKIGPSSFATWDWYFKSGKYQMDKESYQLRYNKVPPY